jgi:hypothetical protein
MMTDHPARDLDAAVVSEAIEEKAIFQAATSWQTLEQRR